MLRRCRQCVAQLVERGYAVIHVIGDYRSPSTHKQRRHDRRGKNAYRPGLAPDSARSPTGDVVGPPSPDGSLTAAPAYPRCRQPVALVAWLVPPAASTTAPSLYIATTRRGDSLRSVTGTSQSRNILINELASVSEQHWRNSASIIKWLDHRRGDENRLRPKADWFEYVEPPGNEDPHPACWRAWRAGRA